MYQTRSKGAAALTATILLLVVTSVIVMGTLVVSIQFQHIIRLLTHSTKSRVLAESVLEDTVFRVRQGMDFQSTNSIAVANVYATATVTTISPSALYIVGAAKSSGVPQQRWTTLLLGSGVAFNFGVQSGEGGIILENSSSVSGNAYSNGPIQGSSNVISGTVVSAGPTGLINGIHATGSAYAVTITGSTIDRDAYYQNISGTTVTGTSYPGSPAEATSTFPISQTLVDEWKASAEAGGVISTPCPYIISSDVTIGPVKITCDLEIKSSNFTVDIAGPVWVEGTITIKNGPTLRVDSSLAGQSVALIASNPTDTETSSQIWVQNSATFQGSGNNSYILLLSENDSASNGGSNPAIVVGQSASGKLLVYTMNGEINLEQSVDIKEVTAWRIRLKNSANVKYESGLANLLFNSGPGGGFQIDGWEPL